MYVYKRNKKSTENEKGKIKNIKTRFALIIDSRLYTLYAINIFWDEDEDGSLIFILIFYSLIEF